MSKKDKKQKQKLATISGRVANPKKANPKQWRKKTSEKCNSLTMKGRTDERRTQSNGDSLFGWLAVWLLMMAQSQTA